MMCWTFVSLFFCYEDGLFTTLPAYEHYSGEFVLIRYEFRCIDSPQTRSNMKPLPIGRLDPRWT